MKVSTEARNKIISGLIVDYPFYFSVSHHRERHPRYTTPMQMICDDLGEHESYGASSNEKGRTSYNEGCKWAVNIDFIQKNIIFFFKSDSDAVKYRLAISA